MITVISNYIAGLPSTEVIRIWPMKYVVGIGSPIILAILLFIHSKVSVKCDKKLLIACAMVYSLISYLIAPPKLPLLMGIGYYIMIHQKEAIIIIFSWMEVIKRILESKKVNPQ